jgi:hypothetical protein
MLVHRLRRLVLATLFLIVLSSASPGTARAAPWIDAADNATTNAMEDRYADGDLDVEDLYAHARMIPTRARAPSRGPTWLSLVGFTRTYADGRRDLGAMAVIGLPLDKLGAAPLPRERDAPPRSPRASFVGDPPPGAGAPPATESLPIADGFPLAPALARATVAAAWRAAGLEASDARIDAVIARARLGVLLPETRLRAMRVVDEQQRTDVVADEGKYYDTSGANLWLEARLTWRFDKLLYADDEPTLERMRLDRQEARARIATRVLELLFQWQRARRDVQTSPAGSRAALEATLRFLEAETSLDVVTGGWFASRSANR